MLPALASVILWGPAALAAAGPGTCPDPDAAPGVGCAMLQAHMGPPELSGTTTVVEEGSDVDARVLLHLNRSKAGDGIDYDSAECWAQKNPECGGTRQSPIDIEVAAVSAYGSEALITNYPALTDVLLRDTGHGLQVDVPSGSDGVLFNEEPYDLLQFHFHFPSEHAVDGEAKAGEMHLVHRLKGSSGYNDLLVVGVFFELGEESPLFRFLDDGRLLLDGANDTADTIDLDGVWDLDDASSAITGTIAEALAGAFWRYDGSLTTPPCTESVKWLVLQSSLTASAAQLEAFGQAAPGGSNNRPLQPRNGRALVHGLLSTNVHTGLLDCPAAEHSHERALLGNMGRHATGAWPGGYAFPQCWGVDYPNCLGRAQSPIDIPSSGPFVVEGDATLSPSYTSLSDLSVHNNGHGLQVDGAFGSLTVSNGVYEVGQFHIHCPSEHVIDGREYDCELHIVHVRQGSSGFEDLLVVGIMYELGDPSDLVEWLVSDTGETRDVDLGAEFSSVMGKGFYRYEGSLTTPPCDETVKWFVLRTPLTLSQAQLDKFKALYPGPTNNRPAQLLNGRKIFKDGMLPAETASSWEGCSEAEGDAGAGQGHGDAWSYTSPQCWSSVAEENAACDGRQQSPVDIITAEGLVAASPMKLFPNMGFVSVPSPNISNTGHGLQVHGEFDTITLFGVQYEAMRLELHFPAEHTLDGTHHAGELHIVHQKVGSSGTADLLVIAILLDVHSTASNHPLVACLGLPIGAPQAVGHVATSPCAELDLRVLLDDPFQGNFYHYEGSLTTPPCTESVKWVVLGDTEMVSVQQVEAFRAATFNLANNRPVQPLGGRALIVDSFFGCPQEAAQPGGEHGAAWSYLLPQCWGQEYPSCHGTRQSPININTGDIRAQGDHTISPIYKYATVDNPTIQNNGHALQVDGNFGTFAYSDSETYDALQLHIHFPSEHAVDGVLAAAELHIVHQLCIEGDCAQGSSTENLLVIALMFDLTSTGDGSEIMQALGLPSETPLGESFTLAGKLPQMEGGYFRYDGSLTTPDCSEGVKWFVLEERQTVTAAQVNAFHKLFAMPMSNRPLQLTYGRTVVKGMLDTNVVPGEDVCPSEEDAEEFASRRNRRRES